MLDRPPASQLISPTRFYLAASLAIGALHAALYCVDPTVQFFLGDSASYLTTSWRGYIPPDRSYLYGFVLGWVMRLSSDLASVVAFQVAVHCATSLLFLVLAREFLGARSWRALATTLVATALPAHTVWTRYVMTETLSVFALLLFVLFALLYIRSARWFWLLPVHAAGLFALTLRLVMVPAVLVTAVALPLCVAVARRNAANQDPRREWGLAARRGALHLAISLTSMLAMHHLYCVDYAQRLSAWVGIEPRLPASYSHASGASLLCLVAPLLVPEDFPAGIDGRRVLDEVTFPLVAREREPQRWMPGGLFDRLKAAVGDETDLALIADAAATETAHRALARDPMGFVALGLSTLTDYLDSGYLSWTLRRDLMLKRRATAEFRAAVRTRTGTDPDENSQRVTPLKQAYLAMPWYYAGLAFAFTVIPLALWWQRRERWLSMALLGGLLIYFNLAAGLLALFAIPRYLLPVSWLLWLFVAGFQPDRRTRPAPAQP